MDIPAHIIARFWSRVACTPDPGCWLWLAGRTTAGYGVLHPAKWQCLYAHRLAWQLASGTPPPPGWYVLHTCDCRPCVRNDEAGTYTINGVVRQRFGHLWLGTHADNVADMVEKGRHGALAHPERFPGPLLNRQTKVGEAHHAAKLTEAQVRAIRAIPDAAMSQRAMARLFGVNAITIARIRSGEAWRHVTP